MTAMPKSQSAAAWSVRVVFRSVESEPEGPSGARQRQQYGRAARLIVALQALHWRVSVMSMSDSIWVMARRRMNLISF
jgi:hypothetical protein